ncbi:GntT/GntP/DsdX family permease [Pseudomonas sp. MDT1-85]
MIVVLIIRFRVHAFLALIAACGLVGVGSGMPLSAKVDSFQKGQSNSLGFLAAIIGMGSILGRAIGWTYVTD